jgi:sn-glycerol 3-phosphate transport system substrate-binding protein
MSGVRKLRSRVNLATDENVELLSWWQKMVNDGFALKLDSNTDNGDNAFTSGTVAITLEPTGSLGGFVKGAKFPIGTGYFPISKSALSDPTDQRWVAQRPQFVTAINQLQQPKLTTATQGCSVGVLPQIRKDVENALQAAVLRNQDPKAALTDAQNAANSQIADYNKSLGG